MRQAAQVATKAPQESPGFLKLFDNEIDCLQALPLWMFRLFATLVRCSNYRTGQGQTSIDDLIAQLSPLQPLHGGPRTYTPNALAIRRALVDFERAQIFMRDKGHNQRAGLLFFMIAPRTTKVRPASSFDRGFRPPVDSRKASIDAA